VVAAIVQKALSKSEGNICIFSQDKNMYFTKMKIKKFGVTFEGLNVEIHI